MVYIFSFLYLLLASNVNASNEGKIRFSHFQYYKNYGRIKF
jgi:hypothetical protein